MPKNFSHPIEDVGDAIEYLYRRAQKCAPEVAGASVADPVAYATYLNGFVANAVAYVGENYVGKPPEDKPEKQEE